ncbi:MAG TPA: N-acetylmuramic acid 6-phosphate etherase [candidate division Zixibacteria bacterium]|nr:N-acetylmuramic acid 6-phosphate etherase [candidate division Zixibacteria bacterium]
MADYNELIRLLGDLQTEQVNPNSLHIDQMTAEEIAALINSEDQKVALAVERCLPEIARAARFFAETLKSEGRVFYIGAGTSGRLGVLDAAECPPTFGTDPERIVGVISGGYETLVLSREGVEDREDEAVSDLTGHRLESKDLVIGLAASRRTPYTLAGLAHARSIGCKTVFIICNQWREPDEERHRFDIVIALEVGPEVITGSTRMKSGSAQKMTLNMISTTAMVLLGKTYGNLMVDLQARSDKLAARSRKILMDLFGIPVDSADRLLREADNSVKTAIVMQKFECSAEQARKKLADSSGFISRIDK